MKISEILKPQALIAMFAYDTIAKQAWNGNGKSKTESELKKSGTISTKDIA